MLSLAPSSAPGAMIGTLAYISPEQARDEPITTAADIYAVGVILFEHRISTKLDALQHSALASACGRRWRPARAVWRAGRRGSGRPPGAREEVGAGPHL